VSSDLNFQFADEFAPSARILVVGVGGAGGSAVNRMISTGLRGVEFVAINTDMKALDHNLAPRRIQIGKQLTRGLGAGADPNKGRSAADEDLEEITEAIQGADMIFITAGMGGGTGTGAAPKLAEIARAQGILTVAIVTKPFTFEGNRRMTVADQGIKALREHVDTLVVIPNQRLLAIVDEKTSFLESFKKADSVLNDATRSIADLISDYGNIVGVDFADVKAVMSGSGDALMGVGIAVGEGRGKKAAMMALHSPLLEDVNISGAQGVLIHIAGSSEMTMFEVDAAATEVMEAAGVNANVIFGATLVETMGEEIKVTVIATGFGRKEPQPILAHIINQTEVLPPKPNPDLVRPTFIRNQEPMASRVEVVAPKTNGNRIRLEVDLDGDVPADFGIPAFLRKNGHATVQ